MDNIWTKSYQEGIENVINTDKYGSVVAIFTEACQKYADLPAYANLGKCISYKDLHDKSTQFAAYLQKAAKTKISIFIIKAKINCTFFIFSLFNFLLCIFEN